MWEEDLHRGSGVLEFAPLYRAFRKAGYDLAQLRAEATEATRMLVGAGILRQADADVVAAAFDRPS